MASLIDFMARGDPKNWKEAIFKILFNTKDPSASRIIYFSVIGIIIFIIGAIAGGIIQYNFKIHFIDKPGVHVSFGFYNKDSIGYYIPIQIVNSGDKTLHNIDFKIKSCYMDNFNKQFYDVLYTHEEYQLRDKNTFEQIQKKWCYPDINFSYSNCDVNIYILNSTDLYIPSQICSVYICDLCVLEAFVNASELKEPLSFTDTIFSPRRIDLKITPEKKLDVNVSKLQPFPKVGFNFFSERELCVWEGNCSISDMPDDSILYYLPSLPVNVTLYLKKYNSINMSINYADFGKILSEEIKRGRANLSVICKSDNPRDCPKEIPLSNIKIENIVFE